MNYETVIGLEVHVELDTNSKIFCSCSAQPGAEHNENVCPACCGMPGMIPIVNKQVLNLAMTAGFMLGCDITRTTTFDKKNYFYPDLPSSYQTTQWFAPICTNGGIEIETSQGKKFISLKQIHMEEDAGKLVHDDWTDSTLIDFNRTSVPLVEIVSNPDLSSAEEVIAYLEKLRSILKFAGVSKCKWEEGSMRCDVNLSIRPVGTTELGVRAEMKNMNSLSAIERAIEYEIARHIDAVERGTEVLVQETRRWDDVRCQSFAMRSKETAADYRYFPDPNIMPIVIDDEWFDSVKATLLPQPDVKINELIEMGISDTDSAFIVSSRQLYNTFAKASEVCNNPNEIVKWISTECMSILRKKELSADDICIDPHKLGAIINMVMSGEIMRNAAKKVLLEVFDNDVDPVEYCKTNGLAATNNEDEVAEIVKRVVSENEKSVNDYKSGKTKAKQSLFGSVMKELKGNGNPAVINKLLQEILDNL